jgi:hypothetical protein
MSTFNSYEPPVAVVPTPTYDYGTVYGNISTYLNQVREELADINVDTTAAAASLGTMATNSTTMATNSTTIATNITTIASKLTAIETYQKKMKELGEGPGIHIVGAYDVFQMVSIYKLLIEQAQILENAGASAGTAAAQAEVTRVSQLIKSNIPRDF